MTPRTGHWLCMVLILWPLTTVAERRVALVVSANTGWAMDRPLRHAHDDAIHLTTVLEELGGFDPNDVKVLQEPTTEAVLEAMAVGEAVSKREPVLFVFYYSGHADKEHLHLKGAPLRFDDLYARLKGHPARVKLGVLDACQSGSMLASKGSKPSSAFSVKVDDSLEIQGTAILASSGADELSQETRALRGSFFTHHLVSGLRGAADADHDGKISLGEAYTYTAQRTTIDTAVSEAGAQRPVFRYELKGRGQIYLSQLLTTFGSLRFSADSGRCFVTDAFEQSLVAEVPGGSASKLVLPVGGYLVKCPTAQGYRVARASTTPNATVEVKSLSFRDEPFATGVLKGTSSPNDPEAGLKAAAFEALAAGHSNVAMELFNQVLAKNRDDAEAFRGKAQTYLALAEAAEAQGRPVEAERARAAAIRADPRLGDDPQYNRQPYANFALHQNADLQARAQRPPVAQAPLPQVPYLVTDASPRKSHWLGIGVALFNAHGPLSLSFVVSAFEWLQFSVHFSPLVLGFGLSGRVFPLKGRWSPYLGLGGNFTLAATGAIDGPTFDFTVDETRLFGRSMFDRLGYLEVGLEASNRHWQGELGLAVFYSVPVDSPPAFGVFPCLTVRYFF